jgi:transposase
VVRGHRQRLGAGQKRGRHTGPSPVDRGKLGCKRHALADAAGTPLAVLVTPANTRDDAAAPTLLAKVKPIHGPRGRPRRKPKALVGDRGYGFPWLMSLVVAMRVLCLLAPRGAEHGSGLGVLRWVIERTLAWFGNYRRLDRCYERSGEHFQAFHDLAAALICFGKLPIQVDSS